jgi:hypothetical protein
VRVETVVGVVVVVADAAGEVLEEEGVGHGEAGVHRRPFPFGVACEAVVVASRTSYAVEDEVVGMVRDVHGDDDEAEAAEDSHSDAACVEGMAEDTVEGSQSGEAAEGEEEGEGSNAVDMAPCGEVVVHGVEEGGPLAVLHQRPGRLHRVRTAAVVV